MAPVPASSCDKLVEFVEPPAKKAVIEDDVVVIEDEDGIVATAAVAGSTSDAPEDCAKPPPLMGDVESGAFENTSAPVPACEGPMNLAETPLSGEAIEEEAVATVPVSEPTSDEPEDSAIPHPKMSEEDGEEIETATTPRPASEEPGDCTKPLPSAGEMGDGADTVPVPISTSDEHTDCTKSHTVMPVIEDGAVAKPPIPESTSDESKDCYPRLSTSTMEERVIDIAPVQGFSNDERTDCAMPSPPTRAMKGEAAGTAPVSGSSSLAPKCRAKTSPGREVAKGESPETAPARGHGSEEPMDCSASAPSSEDLQGEAFDAAAVPLPILREPKERRFPFDNELAMEKADEPVQPKPVPDDTCSEAEQVENKNERNVTRGTSGVIASQLTAERLTPSTGNDSKHLGVDIKKFAADPAAFLRRDSTLSRQCRGVLFRSFCAQSQAEFGDEISQYDVVPKKREGGLLPLGPLLMLDIGEHLDCDQLWEGIDLRSNLLLPHLEARIRSLQGKKRRKKKKKTKKANKAQKLDDERSAERFPEIDASQSEKCHTVAEKMGTTELMPGNDSGKKSGTKEVAESDGEGPSSGQPDAMRKQSVRFAPGTKDHATDDKPISDAIEDGFFNLADMELFADDAEQLARQGKLIASDDDSEDSDLGDMNEIESDYELNVAALKNSGGGRKTQKLRYADFFDPPAANVAGSKASRVSKLLGVSDDDALDEMEVETPLAASRSRVRRLIDAMEEENVGKKPWQLRGEVSGFSRPKDSLLDTSMDYDTTLDPKSVMDSNRTETIEDLIRQRIVDGLFDDVIPPLPEDYDANKKKKISDLPDVSQKKPTEGLAEVYEREFLGEKEKVKNESKSAEVHRAGQKKTEIEETEEQREVSRLFEKLASKLDALSGLHFTPGPIKATEEMAVSGDIKALASEEALPEAVSEENLRTAREVYSVDKKKLTGDLEKTRRDRRAAHRRNKRGIKKGNEAKARAARLMEQANPALGEKRRAEEALRRRGKKIRVAQPDAKVLGPKVIRGPQQPGHAERKR
eukprot:GFKZ01009592.1.p1 GENE.GFKZ01009592.1~~GFKZ01009592.1.p1  ORF type:complete len:1032 (-),score=212.85 GFKZ01009592.1:1707-4802(-)